jgi:general secretion pathway protein K
MTTPASARMHPRRCRQRVLAHPRTRACGVAFVLVLWVIAMLSILLGSFALVARTENLQSRHLFDTTQARYAAEAGLNLAVFGLRKADPLQRWVADGRPYDFGYGDAEIEVRITDDSGKIDINAANGDLLTGMFVASGVALDQAQALSDAILDWRDPDDDKRPNGAEIADYKGAGLSYGPANAPFNTVSELQQVLGMNYALYEKLEPALTIYSGSATPNLASAPLEALEAMPNVTPECAQQFIQQRQTLSPQDMVAAGLTLCGGSTPLMAGGGGLTYSVKSRAKLSNGASATLDATIRMGGISAGGRPFVILRWRDGETS